MPTLAIRKCGVCRKLLEIADANETIGLPFIECTQCGSFNIISAERNEWDLMSGLKKFEWHSRIVIFAAFLGGGAGIMFFSILNKAQSSRRMTDILIYCLPFVVLLYSMLFLWLAGKIRRSRQRLTDPNYAAQLRRLGLLK